MSDTVAFILRFGFKIINICLMGFVCLKVTLLVATSVAEEGLDIRQCNVVIRFDLAKTVLAYIQSRGRARKPGSDYILMVERYLEELMLFHKLTSSIKTLA